ncbi:MAG: carbohydrate kinase family protein [Desulfovibrionaceae bacterium]|nr:carbohydrate kinase family protein [Desulfovibrionaceae bacterium]
MSIYVSGSLAFDRIMNFNGYFQDHILKDRLHMLNVCFMVDNMVVRRGGCAGNIAYTLALMGEKPSILSTVGRDFAEYREHLAGMGIRLDGVQVDEKLFTALCYITTDRSNNQITGFYAGAMLTPSTYAFPGIAAGDLAIVSPGNMDDMQRFPDVYRENGVRFIFDPGQQMPLYTKETLSRAIRGAFAYVSNDYELGLTCKLLELGREEDLLDSVEWIITTMAADGCRVRGRDGTDTVIPALPCANVADPTGAGDSQRSGLLFGLAHGLSVPEAARYGSVTASYAIEHQGTQEHSFTFEDFRGRYEAAFGPMPVTF